MLRRRARRLLRRATGRPHDWELVPEGWARAHDPLIQGWDVDPVVEAYRRKLPAFRAAVEGTGPLGVATSPAFPPGRPNVREQNLVLAFAYALALASRNADRCSVLDWGGGLGFHYLLARALLPPGVELDYHCKEVSALCAYGREALPELTFHEDESCLERRYDLVLASSSLQYSERWAEALTGLAGATGRYLYLTRVPVVERVPSFVVLQRPQRHGLATEYLSWVFNRNELLACVSATGLELVREFLCGYRPKVAGAPEQDETRGFLFRAAAG